MMRLLLVLALFLGACTTTDQPDEIKVERLGGTVRGFAVETVSRCVDGATSFTLTATAHRSGPNVLAIDTLNFAWGYRNPADDKFIQPVNNYKVAANSHSRAFPCPPAGETAYIKACVRVLRPGFSATPDVCAVYNETSQFGAPDPVDSLTIVGSGVVGPDYSYPGDSLATPLVLARGWPDAEDDRIGACERWSADNPGTSPWINGKVNEEAVPYCAYAWFSVDSATGDTTRGVNPIIGQYCACFKIASGGVFVGTPIHSWAKDYCQGRCEELFT